MTITRDKHNEIFNSYEENPNIKLDLLYDSIVYCINCGGENSIWITDKCVDCGEILDKEFTYGKIVIRWNDTYKRMKVIPSTFGNE